jgi:nitrate reductase NapD
MIIAVDFRVPGDYSEILAEREPSGRENKIMESKEIHISSMVVHARPEWLQSVKSGIERLAGTEIHGESDEGKLVVVLESDSQTQITDIIEKINNFEHVLNTALVYHQIEQPDAEGNDRL